MCSLRRADGTLYARAYVRSENRPERVEYFDARGSLRQAVNVDYVADPQVAIESGGNPGPDRCVYTTYVAESGTWNVSNIGWLANIDSLPAYLNKADSELAITGAHDEWESNIDWCSIADQSALNFTYSGRTTRTTGYDGYNVVDYGSVDAYCGSTAGACEVTWYSGGLAVESDIRLDDSFFGRIGQTSIQVALTSGTGWLMRSVTGRSSAT